MLYPPEDDQPVTDKAEFSLSEGEETVGDELGPVDVAVDCDEEVGDGVDEAAGALSLLLCMRDPRTPPTTPPIMRMMIVTAINNFGCRISLRLGLTPCDSLSSGQRDPASFSWGWMATNSRPSWCIASGPVEGTTSNPSGISRLD